MLPNSHRSREHENEMIFNIVKKEVSNESSSNINNYKPSNWMINLNNEAFIASQNINENEYLKIP